MSFPNSMLFEVKAVTGVLTLGASQWQVLGLLDVASRSTAGVSVQPKHPPPAVIFTTTANTTISPLVLTEASKLGVAVWQQVVKYDANSSPNNPDLYIDALDCLNQDVYVPAVAYPSPGAWPHSPLTSPTTPAASLIVPGDPDPAEVN